MRELTVEELGALAGYHGVEDEVSSAPQTQVIESAARWYGNGGASLGLRAGDEVKKETLIQLLQQLDPRRSDGKTKLPNNGGRRAKLQAMSLVVSLEKELGIMAMLGGASVTKALLEIMDEGIRAGMDAAETEVAVVRRGRDGLVHKQAAGLIAVATDHLSARPVGGRTTPHLHRHYLIVNVAEGPDGKWTALDGERLFKYQHAMAEIAGERIRRRTHERMGLHWEQDDVGAWRVAGIDEQLRKKMSLRRQQVLAEALRRGLDVTNPDQVEAAQRLTKEGKHSCAGDPSEWDWATEELAAAGITWSTLWTSIHHAARQARRAHGDRQLIETTLGSVPDDTLAARDWRYQAAVVLTEAPAGEHAQKPDAGAWERLDAALDVDMRSDDKRWHDACLGVGRKKSTWSRTDLVSALCYANCPLAEAQGVADRFVEEHAVRLAGVSEEWYPPGQRVRLADGPLYATVETLERERMLLRATKEGVGAVEPLVDEEPFHEVLKALGADPDRPMLVEPDGDQFEMIENVVRGRNAILLIQGLAGSGKSAGFRALQLAGEMTETQVIGACLAANAAANLEKESGIRSYPIAMLLHRLATSEIELSPGAVVVVDEASQASTQQLAHIWEAVKATGGRLMLVGDERQLAAVEAGGMYRAMAKQVPEAVTSLHQTLRQVDPEERAIITLIHDRGALSAGSVTALRLGGTSTALLDRLTDRELSRTERLTLAGAWYEDRGRAHIHRSLAEAASAMAREYWDAVEEHETTSKGQPALILARTNQECRVLNQAAVAEAIARGQLDPGRSVEAGGHTWLVGQRVVARRVQRRYDILNGQAGTVVATWVVPVEWEVTVAWPGGYERTLKRKQAPPGGFPVGVNLEVTLTPAQVRRERDFATMRHEKAKAQLAASKRSGTVAKRQAALRATAKARQWADSLPDGGGTTTVTVLLSKATKEEERLVVRLDSGSERMLPHDYVKRYLEGGYAVTTQRGQGQTVQCGIELGASYVGLSRGRVRNSSHIIIDATALEEATEQERELLGRLAVSLGEGQRSNWPLWRRRLSPTPTPEASGTGLAV